MNLIIALILIISNILVNASSQHPSNNPEEIIRSYYNYIYKEKNVDKAMNLVSVSSYESLGYDKLDVKKMFKVLINFVEIDSKVSGRKSDANSLEIEILDKSSEKIHVKVKQKTVGDETKPSEVELYLVIEHNEWKIVLPKEFFTSLSDNPSK